MFLKKQIFFNIVIILLIQQTTTSMDRDGRTAINDHLSCATDSHGNITGGCHITIDGCGHGNGDGGHGSSSDLHCEKGYVGSANSAHVLVSIDGTVCTYSEYLQATAIYGTWAKRPGSNDADKVLGGAQALIAGIIKVLQKINQLTHEGQTGHFTAGRTFMPKGLENLKAECAQEFHEKTCVLENINHYCFKDFNGTNEPKHHFKSEAERKKVEGWTKKLNDAKI